MKKLIAMIGAVAMSFCAFADEPAAKLGISFETDEPGVGEGTFTPGEAGGKWSWPSGDPLELGAYATGELDAAGVYEASGDKERRTDEFPGGNDNRNYLKLDTGTAELIRTNDAPAGAGYVDQLVKFTGFEDPQTNLTAGIGVWMGEFVTNETEDVELTETNLYVTVGKGAEQIALKIDKFGDDDFVAKIGQWYRLTIKPLGNIYKGDFEGDTRAGFAIYINGEKVSSSDSDAKDLTEYKEQMTKAAKDAMDAGQLFTAVTAGPAAHTLAGFKGAGAIDDIILTAEPPAFTIETVDVTFAPITGAIIDKVEDAEGEVEPVNGVYTVKPGELTVTLAAAPGYRINSTGEYTVNTDDAEEGEITIEDAEGDVEAAVAYVVNAATPATTNYTFEAELLTMVNGLVDGDTATFTADATIMDDEDPLYENIPADTTIDVEIEDAVTNWTIAVAGEGSWPTDNVGAGENFVKVYTFADEDGGLTLGAITVSGVLKAAALSTDYSITLLGSGKVMTKDNELLDSFLPEDEVEVSEQPDGEGYYTYQIAATGFEVVIPAANTGTTLESIEVDGEAVQNPEAGTYEAEGSVTVTYALVSGYRLASGSADLVQEFTEEGEATAPTAELIPTEDVVTITIGGQSTGYPSAQAALEAVWAAEQDESNYPIIVTATAAGGLTINYNEQTAQIAQNDTITINRGSWAFSGALAYKGRIDGAVSATEVSIIAGGAITLGAAGQVKVNAGTALTTGSFEHDTGYTVIADTTTEPGKVIFKTQQDSPTPTATPGISFEAGEAGVDGTTFTPGAGWTWGSADTFEIGAYAGETLPYGAEGTLTERRYTFFLQGRDNSNYLKLDTSANELVRTMAATNGYVDQLIKFTGYEDIQTNFAANTKIAVWMGEICTNDDTEAMTTNLYVTVGKVAGGSTKQVALKIKGDYKLDTWYRLTVKPIGNIYGGGFMQDTRAGFAVYINGVQVGSDDDDAKTLTEFDSSLTAEASKLMTAGKLFTAIDGTSTSFDKVAYNGIGAIDDIILTADKPAFIVDECTFTIAPPPGLYVVSVKNGATVLTPPYKVDPGTEVTITFGALPGWKITGNSVITRTINTDGQEITPEDDEIEFEEAVAYVVNAGDLTTTNYYLTAELLTMVNGLVDGDTATFTADATIMDDEDPLYENIPADTTIDVEIEDAVTNWTIAVAGEGSWPTDNVGAGENFVKVYTFADEDGGLTLGAITVSGVLKAAALSTDYSITLLGSGKVMTKDNELLDSFLPEDEVEVSEQPDGEGYYTYQIKAAPGTFKVTVPDLTEGLEFVAMTNGDTEVTTPAAGNYTVNEGDTFTVVYAPATGYEFTEPDEDGVCEATKEKPTITPPEVALQTFAVTFATVENGTVETSVTNGILAGTEVTVTATPGAGYALESITTNDAAITGNTFVMPAEDVTVGATFTRQMVTVTLPTLPIEGVSELVVSQKVDEVWEEVTGDTLTIGVGNEYVVVAIPAEGYRAQNPIATGTAAVGTPIEVTERQVKDNVTKINYVAQVGNTKYETLAEAVVVDGDVTLLANVTLTETLTIAKAKALNLAGKTITFGDGLKNGIVTTAAAEGSTITISNGNFAVADTRPAGGFAFQLYRVNATIKDVTMDVEGFEYGLEAETMLEPMSDNWAKALIYTITCENVKIQGNGSLFHFENVNATLDENCSATLKGTSFGGAHAAAIYSSCGAKVTVNGGTFEAPNTLQTGNLGGDITVNSGTFNGNIKSFMYENDKRYDGNKATIAIAGGTFTGDFTYATDQAGECTKDCLTWNITGGTFSVDPTTYLNEGYKAVKNQGEKDTWTVSAKAQYDVTVECAEGATVNGVTAGKVYEGTNINFTVTVTDETKVIDAVKNGDTTLTDVGGTYTIADVQANVAIKVTLKTKEYDITFTDAGAWTNVVKTAHGVTPVAPNAPEVIGKSFKEWNPAIVAAVADATYTAVYTGNVYAITYTYTDGTDPVTVTANTNPESFTYGVGVPSFSTDALTYDTTKYENPVFSQSSIGKDVAEDQTITVTFTKKATDPIPVPEDDTKVAETLAAAGITAADVTTVDDVKALNAILKANNITDAKTGLTADQKAHINDTFLMSQNGITPNHIYSEAAQIKIDKIEATETSGKWAFEVTIADGTTPVAAAEIAAKALAGSAKKATTLGTWATIEAADIETAAKPGTAGKVTFTVNYGNGQQGFLKIDVSKAAQ